MENIQKLEPKFTENVKEILEDLNQRVITSGSNLITEITLKDGRKAQIFVNITTDEYDFV